MPALWQGKGMVQMFAESYTEREAAMNRFEAAINVLIDLAAKGDLIEVEWQARNIAKNVASGDLIPTNF